MPAAAATNDALAIRAAPLTLSFVIGVAMLLPQNR
jgi:hypothetical protein